MILRAAALIQRRIGRDRGWWLFREDSRETALAACSDGWSNISSISPKIISETSRHDPAPLAAVESAAQRIYVARFKLQIPP